MIVRVWRGVTTAQNARPYRDLLEKEVLPGIAAKKIDGYRGIDVLRRPLDSGEVEFVTVMRFDDLDAVRQFAGDDPSRSYVPDRARALLARFDEHAAHYELQVALEY